MNRVIIWSSLTTVSLFLLAIVSWAAVYVYLMPNPRELTHAQRFQEWQSTVRFVSGALFN